MFRIYVWLLYLNVQDVLFKSIMIFLVYRQLYKRSLDSFPGAHMLLAAMFCIVALGMNFYLYTQRNRMRRSQKNEQDDDPEKIIDKPVWKLALFGTGCTSHFENRTNIKILKEPLLVQKKLYTSRKPLVSALIWHPESGRGIIRRAWRWLAVEELFLPHAHLCFSRQGGVAPSW